MEQRKLLIVVSVILFEVISSNEILAFDAYETYNSDVSPVEGNNALPRVSWHFSDGFQQPETHARVRRMQPDDSEPKHAKLIDEPECTSDIRRLCDIKKPHDDDLVVLECVQTFRVSEVAGISEACQHIIWTHIVSLTNDENVKALTKEVCDSDLDRFDCDSPSSTGGYLSCIIEKRHEVQNLRCQEYIQRLEWVAFSDFRIITHFMSDCKADIQKFKCGRIQPYRELSQGQTLVCLQESINKLEPQCKKRVLHVSELQADNIKLDRQLYMACTQDHIKFCPNIKPGSGQVYKCLMQHKTDRSMTPQCQAQLLRREKLMTVDYKVSNGLVRACKEDIKNYHCRRAVADDRDIKLAQILLCLESAVKNMSKISQDCQVEMFDHRKILMEDYRLSPEIVNDCAGDISNYCNGLEVGGKTIHCLMEHTRMRKNKSWGTAVTPECQRALEGLVKEADAGEDWRVDPVLRDACQPVVDVACKDVRGGDARVISCLMEKLGTDRMTEACETALVQIQYFVARDFKLDPQLYKACRADAIRFCHAKRVWAGDESKMDPERGPLVLPCLYRYAYHPQSNMTLKPGCLSEIKRVMRQRAINVDLQPEVEEACLSELALYCYEKTEKGQEISCLQDNLDSLDQKCKLAVGNLTEEQAEHVELNPLITTACQRVMEKHCEAELKLGKDEGDLMECLIEHKNDPDVRVDYKCRAAVEHFQLISMKNYHFTYKFKKACRPHVMRWCPSAKTKTEVIHCLSSTVQEDIAKDTSHRVPKECRQQLRAQLYQQREDIRFDPDLQRVCQGDIDKWCKKVESGNSQVLECLASQKSRLSEQCHKSLFRVRKQEFQDSSGDFALLNTCHAMIRQFCHDRDQSKALDCLKIFKEDPNFDEKCKNLVVKRMIEQNTDYRFNPVLQSGCSLDIDRHCRNVLDREPSDKELQGKVIQCLKTKFREAKLTTNCEQQMAVLLREAALNYHLNPLLATMCSREIETICRDNENGPGSIEECLKTQFNRNNAQMQEGCRLEVAYLIEQAKADINVDPLLQKACAVDVSKYCNDVTQGAGRHILCLQNVLNDENKSLQPDCYKMLSSRIEMFRNAEALVVPKSMNDLYVTLNKSPARTYFMMVSMTMIGVAFIVGMFCGKVARRTLRMKIK